MVTQLRLRRQVWNLCQIAGAPAPKSGSTCPDYLHRDQNHGTATLPPCLNIEAGMIALFAGCGNRAMYGSKDCGLSVPAWRTWQGISIKIEDFARAVVWAAMTRQLASDELNELIIHTRLENGAKVCLRSIRPSDEEQMRKGIAQLSLESRYLRFFTAQPMPSDRVIEKLVDVDGHRHIAWGAILSDAGGNPAIGAVHVIRDDELSQTGEFSVAIVDAYHGQGLARMLTAVLLANCRIEGITSLEVQILSQNRAAINLVNSLGGKKCGSESSVSDYTLDTETALDSLGKLPATAGLQDVFSALRIF